ncbi:hypothetical protein [Thalassospira sp.]|uniref:hypothetical protein n=1 Tax=Thalassospira sp. TaxID=1912094 RepID=UPI00273451BD|nr:hypothetical protein [Thalassospira sp.]MDP2698174.1 hypothetical protein [Thalassospira sp.]
MRFRSAFHAFVMIGFVCFFAVTGMAQAETMILFPVQTADLTGIEDCSRGQNAYCDRCDVANHNNVSLVNYTILRHALQAGGMAAQILPVESPNSERSRMMVFMGQATVKTDWNFNIDGNDQVYKTQAFMMPGDFKKGVYGLADNAILQSVTRLEDLRRLRAVMNPNWRLDWQILEQFDMPTLFSASTTPQMFRLIAENRADFTLLEFSSAPDMGREVEGIRLVPVPGITVALPGSQHFMVSRAVPNAPEIVAALNRGITILRNNGFIGKCLRQGGILHDETADWAVLNPGAGH